MSTLYPEVNIFDAPATTATPALRLDLVPESEPARSRPTATLDSAAAALHELEDLVSFVARGESENATRRAESAIARLADVLHDYGLELAEVLPQRTCADCKRTNVIEYRFAPDVVTRSQAIVCTACWHARHEADDDAHAKRDDILDRAREIVASRESCYGDPKRGFAMVAGLWSVLLGASVTPSQVALMMIALKLARLSETPSHIDSWIDAAGYAGLGAEVSASR